MAHHKLPTTWRSRRSVFDARPSSVAGVLLAAWVVTACASTDDKHPLLGPEVVPEPEPPSVAERVGQLVLDVPVAGQVRGLTVDATQVWVGLLADSDGWLHYELHRIPFDGGPVEVFDTPIGAYEDFDISTGPERGTVVYSGNTALFVEPGKAAHTAYWQGRRVVERILPSPDGWWLVFKDRAAFELVAGEIFDVGLGPGPATYTIVELDGALWAIDQQSSDPLECMLTNWDESVRTELPGQVVATSGTAVWTQEGPVFTAVDPDGGFLDAFSLGEDPPADPSRCEPEVGFSSGGMVGGPDHLYRWRHEQDRLRVDRF